MDYNRDITLKMLHLIGLDDVIGRHAAAATHPASAPRSMKYYQTFQRRHSFIEGMSILDLLFNEGPEAIKYI